ncbi:hypothetical protein CRENBAI_009808 [Crenichthys baileyi]|uniref:Uncharacterized protein n=1 Tax=Crenichthys baileyi TaxID=28760 RepID=A0AAV9S0Q6_9TELE
MKESQTSVCHTKGTLRYSISTSLISGIISIAGARRAFDFLPRESEDSLKQKSVQVKVILRCSGPPEGDLVWDQKGDKTNTGQQHDEKNVSSLMRSFQDIHGLTTRIRGYSAGNSKEPPYMGHMLYQYTTCRIPKRDVDTYCHPHSVPVTCPTPPPLRGRDVDGLVKSCPPEDVQITPMLLDCGGTGNQRSISRHREKAKAFCQFTELLLLGAETNTQVINLIFKQRHHVCCVRDICRAFKPRDRAGVFVAV